KYKEGHELDVKLGEVGLHDSDAGMGKLDGYDVCVGGAARLVGKKVRARIERVMHGMIYASLVEAVPPKETAPITAEGLAEKPTRGSPRKSAAPVEAKTEEPEEAEEPAEEPAQEEEAAPATPRKRTRRGSRGGRRRRKPAAAAASENGGDPQAAETPA